MEMGNCLESWSRIKDGNGRLAQGKDEVQKIWKNYFEYLYNIDTQEQVAVHMCVFDGIQSQLEELKNEKDEITGEIIGSGLDLESVI